MVIGDRFVWCHLPKTGGEATRALFQLFPDLIHFAESSEANEKQHISFRDREESLSGKLLALNIRRLPAWILSREHHKARWGLYPDLEPTPPDSPEQMAESSFPDYRLSTFIDNGRFPIDRWIRMESLADDFLNFISEFTTVTDEQRKRVFELGSVNALEYDHEVSHWFTEEQVRKLYKNNPLWSAVEKSVYGG